MKKKFDTTDVMNELRGQSAFFPARMKTEIKEEMQPSSYTQQVHTNVSEATVVPRYQDTTISSNHDTTVPVKEVDILELVRKSVKRIGKEAATHRCTLEERQALDDIEYQYKRQGIRTSGNEITRIAVNYIVEDYKKHGEKSVLAKILKQLNS